MDGSSGHQQNEEDISFPSLKCLQSETNAKLMTSVCLFIAGLIMSLSIYLWDVCVFKDKWSEQIQRIC